MFEIDPKKYAQQLQYYSILYSIEGIIAIAIAFVAINNNSSYTVKLLGVLICLFIIIISIPNLKNAFDTRHYVNSKSKKLFINYGFLFVLGVFMIFFTNETVELVVRITGTFLLITSISNYLLNQKKEIYHISWVVVKSVLGLFMILDPEAFSSVLIFFIQVGFILYGIYKIIFGIHLYNLRKKQ